MILRLFPAALAALLLAAPAHANDGYAEMAAGGLVLSRTDAIRMEREDLYVSLKEIRVDYVFRNITNRPIEARIMFPLPEVREDSPMDGPLLQAEDPVNFIGFTVVVDGRGIRPEAEIVATVDGNRVDDVLRTHGLPLNPRAQGIEDRILALPESVLKDLEARRLLEYNLANRHAMAFWGLKVTYHWTQIFPPNAEVRVSHRYRPMPGGQILSRENFLDAQLAQTFCIDQGFQSAALRRMPSTDSTAGFVNLTYILTTANSWVGPIGRFRLVVDKGEPDTLISLCAPGIRRVSPTTFEWVRENFRPTDELRVLFLPARQ